MIVKVCGLKHLDDALFAVEWGANAIGLNFYPSSPRFLSQRKAEELCRKLEGSATRVGVFVGWPNRPYPFLDVLQIHGLEPAARPPAGFEDREIWIACSPREAPQFGDRMVVIDTSWGRGQKADWNQVATLKQPFILSGGLDASNIARALAELQPAGVDVCSGVESRPGEKDRAKLRDFLQAVTRFGARG